MGLFDFLLSYNKRELKAIQPILSRVLALDEEYKRLSDAELRAKTAFFRERFSRGESLDSLLPEAFAAVREAADRTLHQKHFSSQIIGGIVLHQGRIAEMKTGEGKTLTATLPLYLNSLSGKGAHLVTVNDYLAKRDSEWMGKVYSFLDTSVGLIVHGLDADQRRRAYGADITYGTNNEFGFDYLKDNMVVHKKDMVQREHNFAIVDEVDSILIDEARTPLIISGVGEESNELYAKANAFVRPLKRFVIGEMESKTSYEDVDADYIVEEKNKTAVLSARGVEKAQRFFGVENIADPENTEIQHHINQALRAYGTMHRDVDYVVKDGQVLIVDEFTGRIMIGRRYSNGLHQAIEAKEGVNIEKESKTLATITFQNYFRGYTKLAGMTGTALTEEEEFRHIYKLDVIEIPTNKPVIRVDENDAIFKSELGKFSAVCDKIAECHQKGQPVLVGTVNIEKSEKLSRLLSARKIPHNVLNAKHHEKEAEIIAQAGKKGAVTIATNMAGRGTDIVLGGNPEALAKHDLAKEDFTEEQLIFATSSAHYDDEGITRAQERYKELYEKHLAVTKKEAEEVRAAGGLFILGTERHESRRIDNQLRGRSGRQGDPGTSLFCLSLQDDLMRLFGGDRMEKVANSFNLKEDEAIDTSIFSGIIESAQKKVEGLNFARRKRVLEYDDVINLQRETIYKERRRVLDGEDLASYIKKMVNDVIEKAITLFCNAERADEWNLSALEQYMRTLFLAEEDSAAMYRAAVDKKTLKAFLLEKAEERYAETEQINTPEIMREAERIILLKNVDKYWMEHIDAMDDLKQSVSLQSYAQHNPVVEYKMQSFDMFDEMISAIKEDTVRMLMRVRVKNMPLQRKQAATATSATHGDAPQKAAPVKKTSAEKVGRNDPCPCGSGLKYKKCCGKE